ncbi:hypothetical protein EB118_02015 [bacterium]|nr:hypothetical protein [bacterium]NDD83025.1 hypothetical protein [bacterium]NDG28863.1 hypothetical protein [bacterium]
MHTNEVSKCRSVEVSKCRSVEVSKCQSACYTTCCKVLESFLDSKTTELMSVYFCNSLALSPEDIFFILSLFLICSINSFVSLAVPLFFMT